MRDDYDSPQYVRYAERIFPALLTAASRDNPRGEWRYAWVQLAHSGLDGAYLPAAPPLSGTLQDQHATELSGLYAPPGTRVWMRLKGSVANRQAYEFCLGAPYGAPHTDEPTGDRNDYAPPAWADVLRVSRTTAVTYTGFALTPGRTLTVVNVNTGPVTLSHQDTNSLSTNRLRVPGGGDLVLSRGDSAALYKDPGSGDVLVFSTTAPPARPSQAVTTSTSLHDQPLDPSTDTLVVETTASSVTLTGLAAPPPGKPSRPVVIQADPLSTHPLTIKPLDSGSLTANRVRTPGLTDLSLPPGFAVTAKYDPSLTAWLIAAPLPRGPWRPTLTTDQNDLAVPPASGTFEPTLTSAAVTVTGLAGLPAGFPLTVTNATTNSYDLTLAHQSSSSSASNRFDFSTGADVVLSPGESVTVISDGTRHYDVSGSLSLGGGGGGVSGSGTANTLAMWSGASALTDSPVTYDGSSQIDAGAYLVASERLWLRQGASPVNRVKLEYHAGGGATPAGWWLRGSDDNALSKAARLEQRSGATQVTLDLIPEDGQSDVAYAVNGSRGAGATTGGLTFVGGLYMSGTLSVSAGGVTGLASVATTGAFSDLSSTPTTLAGYGITDAASDAELAAAEASLVDYVDAEVGSRQPLDADLTALAALASTGLVARTAADTYALRTLTAPAAGITVSNGGGVAGNPTLALANDLAGVEALSGVGLAARTGTDTWVTRSVTGPAAGLSVTNGSGAGGDVALALANDLSALEALSGTGIARRTGADAWSVGTTVSTAEIADNAVTLAKLATQGADTILANATTGSAVPTAVAISASQFVGRTASSRVKGMTAAEATAMLDNFVAAGGSNAKGLVPAPGSTAKANRPDYLAGDGTWKKRTGELIDASFVATLETTTSGTGADLATAQHITFTLDETSDVWVIVGATTSNTVGGAVNRLVVDVDGADTTLAQAAMTAATTNYNLSNQYNAAALASGAHTIKLQFSTNAGTASFSNRSISVWRKS